MCCCATPNVNGEPGYRWGVQDRPSIRQPDPPRLGELDTVMYDLPGRCGGMDSHCHHLILTGQTFLTLHWKHGGGEGQCRIAGSKMVLKALQALPDDTARYWVLLAIYHAQNDADHQATHAEASRWRQAAYDGRIKVNRRLKCPTVSIEPKAPAETEREAPVNA